MSARISVAMGTCNGERWLAAQLASIAAQTRQPDELVVCDDASDDGTLQALKEFAARAPFPVRVEANPKRLGVAGNFDKAIGLCSGELIAPSDQDDVWLPAKLERCAAQLESDSGASVVFSDAQVVDETLLPVGHTLWQAVRFSAAEQARVRSGDALPVLLRHQVVTGTAMMFRAALKPLVMPIDRGWIHDGWIAMLAAATSRLIPIAEPLLLYRQHEANVIGARRRGWLSLLRQARRPAGGGLEASAARFRAVRERLAQRGASDEAVRQLDDAIHHHDVRMGLAVPRWRRLVPVLRESLSGRYQRYSRGVESIAQDLIL